MHIMQIYEGVFSFRKTLCQIRTMPGESKILVAVKDVEASIGTLQVLSLSNGTMRSFWSEEWMGDRAYFRLEVCRLPDEMNCWTEQSGREGVTLNGLKTCMNSM